MNEILEQINMTGQRFIEHAFVVLIQSSVLIMILLLADLLLRRKVRAVFRYWIWMLVLLKLVLPTSLSTPVSLGHLFGDELAYVDISQPATKAETIETTEAFVTSIIDPSRIEGGKVMLAATVAPVIPDVEPAEAEPAELIPMSVTPLSWQGLLFLLWLAVVAAMGLLLLQRAVFVRRLIGQACAANDMMNEALEYCCQRMGIRKNVSLKISVNATSPAVCGLFRPVILLPRNLGPTLGSSHLRTVLMHELAHIKRGDLWINTVQTALQIVYFYNPLLWLTNAIIRRVREQAVDETVLVAMGPKAQQYPETLLNVARLAWQRPALSLRLIGVIESKSQLKERIRKMLERPIPKSAKLGIAGMMIVFALGVFLLPMAKADNKTTQTPIAREQSKENILQFEKDNNKFVLEMREFIEQAKTEAKELLKIIEIKVTDADRVDISMQMPPIEPPQEAIRQLQTILAKKVSLEQEISKLHKELEQKLQLDDIPKEEAKELNNKIEAMEEKIEQVSDQLEECIEQIEDWSEQVSGRMEDWGEDIQEQLEDKYGEKYEKELEQFEQRIELWSEQFEQQTEQWGERFEEQMEQLEEQLEEQEERLDEMNEQRTQEYKSSSKKFRIERIEQISAPLKTGLLFEIENRNGSITITGGKEPECKGTATIEVKADSENDAKYLAEQINIKLESTDKKLSIKVDKPDTEVPHSVCVNFNLKVPSQTNLNVISRNGEVKLSKIVGDVKGTTRNGSVTINEVTGNLYVQTRNGHIDTTMIIGDMKLLTRNGHIKCREISGDFTGNTRNGKIKVAYSKNAPNVCNVSITTRNGGIDFAGPANFSAGVEAKTEGGSITTELPLRVSAESEGSRVKKASGTLGKGEGKLYLKTRRGSIKIR